MTDSGPPEDASDPFDPFAPGAADVEPRPPLDGAVEGPWAEETPAAGRPGLRTFSLEHRVAPGLYLVGWLACLIGAGLLIVSILSAASIGRAILLVGGLALLSLGLVAGAGQQALERRAQGWTGYAGPSPFIVFPAAVAISLVLTLLAAFGLSALHVDFDSAAGIIAASLATVVPFIGLVRLLVIGTGALSVADLGFLRLGPATIRGIVAGALWGVAIVFGTGVLALGLSTLLPAPAGPLPVPTTTPDRIAVLIVAVVLAPVSEEIFFRGFATTAWARTMPRRAAIVRSGLFFAFIHVLTISGAATFGQGLGFATFAFLTRIPVSIALAAVFLRRGSIYESLALHSTFNALPLVFVFLTPT